MKGVNASGIEYQGHSDLSWYACMLATHFDIGHSFSGSGPRALVFHTCVHLV